MQSPKTAVVILNYNGQAYLQQFLPSVVRYSPADVEIIVADNASTDNSLAFLKENYAKVRIIINERNEGFAGGYNRALEKVDADYFVLLNSDVEVTEGWLDTIPGRMAANPKIAAAQPKILSFKEKNKFEYAGAAGGFMDKNAYAFCRGRLFDNQETDLGQYDDEVEVFWASGACLFIRADLYKSLGGLDEDFFAHMEEIDLCWRLKNLGYQIRYYPSSTVFHVGGGTLSNVHPRKTYLNFRNNLYMLVKNYQGVIWTKLSWRMSLDGIAALKLLIEGKPLHFWAVVRAHISFYSNFRAMMKKRKFLCRTIVEPNNTGLYKRNFLIDFFILKKKTFNELDKKAFD